MANYVKMYKDAVKQYRELHPGPGKKLQKHHVWPVSLGGKNSAENYVYVKRDQHRLLHTLLNLALLQTGNKDALVSLDYSQMVPMRDLDISMFRNSRFVLSRGQSKVKLGFTKAVDLFRALHPLAPSGNPPGLNEMKWRVLVAAMFGYKYMGFRLGLELHKRKDDNIRNIIES